MSRLRTDLRPSITRLSVKGSLPSINTEKDKSFADSIKGQALDLTASQTSPIPLNRKKSSNEKKENIDHLLKEIEKWRSKFTNSQRSLEECRSDVKFKTDTIQTLDLKIETLENDFKRDLQLAKDKLGSHTKCKKEIESLREMLDQKEKQIDKLTDDLIQQTEEMQNRLDKVLEEKQKELEENEIRFQEEKESLQKEFETKMSELKQDCDKQMEAKDERLALMKKQIAEALTGSSLERQQQIEELLKELKRVSDEAETVKAALRGLKSKGDCQKCVLYEKKIKELQEQMRSKDVSLNELMKISTKMEKQISQQDELFAIWTKVKNENKKTPR